MTVNTDICTAGPYAGNGVTTVFSVPFYWLVDTDLKVTKLTAATGLTSTLVLNSDYTLSGAGNQSGGSLTTAVAPLAGDQIYVERNVDAVQQTAYPSNSPFPASSHEKALDRLTMLVQQNGTLLGRALVRSALQSTYDLGNNVLVNSGTAVNPNDVPTYVQVQGMIVGGAAPALASSNGSSLVGWIQSGAGAVQRTSQDKMRDVVSVFDFMTAAQITDAKVGTQIYDMTAAMQAAHNTGNRVYYPSGNYKFSTISFSSGGIVGDGPGKTILTSTNATTANLITYTGTGGGPQVPLFRDFLLQAANTKADGAALSFIPSSGEISYVKIDNIVTYNVPYGVSFTAASLWTISDSKFLNYTASGLYVQNTNHVDSGDSAVVNCLFSTAQASGTRYGIWQRSSGGLKITNCKFNGGQAGYVLGFVSSTQSTGDLAISNCSIENMLNYGIYLGRDSGSFGFGAITLSNIQIAICPNGIVTDNSGAISQVSITGHNIALSSGTGFGIQLNSVATFVVGPGNIIGGGGTPTGINTNAGCSNGKVMRHTFAGIAAANRIVNAATSVVVESDKQSGSGVSVTTSTAYGSLFIGATAVTFTTPFSTTPVVVCSASGTGGGVSAYPVSVSPTGFTLQAVGVTNGGVVTGCQWTAQGII
ncbi:hypothetical protein ACN9MB_09150 [Dyella kyungheensis]|uniref:hypothetical protein n=1 Tax=Dyella kyungheensis TaxID=1242174 RepID=UPI003CF2EAFC